MPDEVSPEWPLNVCKVKEAWALTPPAGGKTKGEGILIGHLDTGWTEHPELLAGGDRYLIDYPRSKNFSLSEAVPDVPEKNRTGEDILNSKATIEGGDLLLNYDGHGTSTASVLFSNEGHPNVPTTVFPDYTVLTDVFVTGVAPKAMVLPQRVTNDVILGNADSDLLKEVNWSPDYYPDINTYNKLGQAIEHCRIIGESLPAALQLGVISISLGGRSESQPLTAALMNARRVGIIVCAAGGHALPGISNAISVAFPASSEHTIGVAGCDSNMEPSSAGFYGERITITAPGFGVFVADTAGEAWETGPRPARNYFMNHDGNGTSFATPFVAASCALWQAFHGRAALLAKYGAPLLFDAFQMCLVSSAKQPEGWDTTIGAGAGVIDVEALLDPERLPDEDAVKTHANEHGWIPPIRNVEP